MNEQENRKELHAWVDRLDPYLARLVLSFIKHLVMN